MVSAKVSCDIILTVRQIQDPLKPRGEAIDRLPPQIVLTLPEIRDGGELTLQPPNDGQVLLNGHITDNTGVTSATLDGARVVLRGDGSFSVPILVEADRWYPLRFHATDAAGNTSTHDLTFLIHPPTPARPIPV